MKKNLNRYRFTYETWEVQMILYFILGILVDKSYSNLHWLAVIIWGWGFISWIGVLVMAYKAKKYEEKEDKIISSIVTE